MTARARRVGIVGTGFGSAVHIPAFQSEGWEVTAVWSRTERNARAAADRFGIPHVFASADDLTASAAVDAVAIVSPPPFHHDTTLTALRAGKHVLCEKPFAASTAQARAMRDLAAETGRTCLIAHEFRFAPQRAHIKRLLDQGYIGDFRLATMDLLFPYDPRRLLSGWMSQKSLGGGLMGALGTHFVDALRHWIGEIASVSARLTRFSPDRNPATGEPANSNDTILSRYTFHNGGAATLIISGVVAPAQGARIVLNGTQGTLVATQPGGNPATDGLVLGARSGQDGLQELPMPPEFVPFHDDRDPRLMPFRLLLRAFDRGIETGTSPAPNFEDGLRGQQVLDAVYRSADEGRTIRLT